MSRQCGIFYAGRHSSSFPLVGASCHYAVIDVQTIAALVQTYVSNASDAQSVVYMFPLPPEAAVCAFKAIIDGDRIVKGVIQEKSQAKENYESAVKHGKTAGLLEKEYEDVFQISLGNIQPNQRIDIHVTFTSLIKHDGSLPHALRLMIPVAIAPRYGCAPAGIQDTAQRTSQIDITISATMTGIISSITSPTHPVALTIGVNDPSHAAPDVHDPTKAHVSITGGDYLDTDVVVVIVSQHLDRPRCVVETSVERQTSAFALSFVPQFNLPPLPSQSYIFLVDRSGSMAGSRIKAVRAALQIMLRSLPTKNTFFNIWSFGDRYKSLWPSNKAYSSDSVAEATAHVDRLQANYGGTEIGKALRAVYNNVREGYLPTQADTAPSVVPTSVFVLTDGEAWDLEGVLDTVRTAAEHGKAAGTLLRTFVLGVGDNVSTPMCEGIARAGQGISVFVSNNEKPDVKLMGLLRSARGAVVDDMTVDWGVFAPSQGDDFEIVDRPASAAPTLGHFEPQLVNTSFDPAPLTLFDPVSDSAPTADDVALGPEKLVVKLGPPPFLQQAPATADKLPIPLYPGFRCSILSLVQTHFIAPPAHIKLTARVLGRAVALDVPVTVTSGFSHPGAADADVQLPIHTLAARALIQQLEDTPRSPERDAEIVRLALRYPLVTSQTSFVAIAEEQAPLAGEGRSDREFSTRRRSLVVAECEDDDWEDDGIEEDEDEDEDELEESDQSTRRRLARSRFHNNQAHFLDVEAEVDEEDYEVDDTAGFIDEEECDRSSGGDDEVYQADGFIEGEDLELIAEESRIKRRRLSKPVTVESLARSQDFNGSFPLSAIADALSTVPLSLSRLFPDQKTADVSEAAAIWSTILVVMYLRLRFDDQGEAWSMMEEKALEYVRSALAKRGVAEEDMDELIDGLREEARMSI